ncbi:MAG: CsbD family protein [Alphaproteobacteria bacterium]
MNSDQIKGNWKILKGKVKQTWGDLTDDEIDRIDGKHDELVGTIQKRYGIAREEAERQVRDWNT